jgi:hypothetical protein
MAVEVETGARPSLPRSGALEPVEASSPLELASSEARVAREQVFEEANSPVAASFAAAAGAESASFELRFARAQPAFREELAGPHCSRLARDRLPARDCSNAPLVSRSQAAPSFSAALECVLAARSLGATPDLARAEPELWAAQGRDFHEQLLAEERAFYPAPARDFRERALEEREQAAVSDLAAPRSQVSWFALRAGPALARCFSVYATA